LPRQGLVPSFWAHQPQAPRAEHCLLEDLAASVEGSHLELPLFSINMKGER
jgi:hypothetical protein